MKPRHKKFLMALGDYALMAIALYLTLLFRYDVENSADVILQHWRPFAVIYIVWLLVFYSWDLYNLTSKWSHKNYFYAMVMNVGIAALYFYVIQSEVTPKTNLLLTAGIFTIFFYIWRFGIGRIFNLAATNHKVLILGSDSHSLSLAQKIVENRKLGFHLRGILRRSEDPLPDWAVNENLVILENPQDVKAFAVKEDIATVIISEQWYGKLFKDLYEMIPQGISFYNLSSFWEDFEQKIPIYATNEIWFLENLKIVSRGLNDGIKRLTDIAFSILVLPPLLILGLLTAALVKLSSKGPVFYTQTRVGIGGKLFRIIKFRSMVQNAETKGAQWSTENDPRITPVGRFLRSTRLDEIPQIINVLRGDMSLVGPRPERPEFVDNLAKVIPHYQLRHLVRPGLTGWAQINYPYGSSVEDAGHKLEYDLYYLKNRGPLLDIKISLKTVMVIFSRKGR